MKKADTKAELRADADAEPTQRETILQLARLRLEIAEARWVEARDEAREARRRRKEAKAIARQTKIEARKAKAELADARNFLAKAGNDLAPSAAPGKKKRKQRPESAATPDQPPAGVTETFAGEAEAEASSESPEAGTVDKLPGPEPDGAFGKWR